MSSQDSSNLDINLSQLSLAASSSSSSSSQEDWDRSMTLAGADGEPPRTPRNTVAFPAEGPTPVRNDANTIVGRESSHGREGGKRTLSELLKAYAEDGRDINFSSEEAGRLADVLGRWVNSDSSPYEGEDTFFRTQDDSSLPSKRAGASSSTSTDLAGRSRGQSESVVASS
ncbi:hypothetical protein PUNSTDRAFT_52567 [Punctularia strigosozonata HHB-11173 SS5]|uniref:uncharacterized protein n=1 Tax=Punctularia strigosozonata (strain HHB-11173) TaxID=741275 RepID=UPI000441707D|nr:uncharacterized protein PUNSTDRAFT_52567 [Punctularia strigosozonata HHB-11173 SS5]EIN09282.1 hypothetical protein PUNSTDRAFT_52567 [Punctularia strigosozonata HHB-11173 SS5]